MITRKEAIDQLKWYFEEDDGTAADPITKQAYKKAIEALEALEEETRKTAVDTSKEEPITNKRYRLTLSAWLDRGKDATEVREKRRTVEYILPPNLFDASKKYEKNVIMEMCKKIMEHEGINQQSGIVHCKDCKHSRTDDSNYDCYHCKFTPGYAHFASGFCERGERKCQPKDDTSHPFADDVLMGGDETDDEAIDLIQVWRAQDDE